MRNRAKCRVCGEVIEALQGVLKADAVRCRCGEIGVFWSSDGEYCSWARSYSNFLRIDDEGKEIPVVYALKGDAVKTKISDEKKEAGAIEIENQMVGEQTAGPEKRDGTNLRRRLAERTRVLAEAYWAEIEAAQKQGLPPPTLTAGDLFVLLRLFVSYLESDL